MLARTYTYLYIYYIIFVNFILFVRSSGLPGAHGPEEGGRLPFPGQCEGQAGLSPQPQAKPRPQPGLGPGGSGQGEPPPAKNTIFKIGAGHATFFLAWRQTITQQHNTVSGTTKIKQF